MKYAQFELIAKYFPIKFQIYGASLPVFINIRRIVNIDIYNMYITLYDKTYVKILRERLLTIENSLDKQIQDY